MSEPFIRPTLPHSPGIYLMRDIAGQIVYIGKARDLKKRVASYFSSKSDQTVKTQALLQVIRHIDYVPTRSEREALVLERRLIFRYQPAFNTMWKDDKSYPYVALTMGEDFPRVFLTRRKKHGKGTRYFGPYPSVGRVRSLLRWAWRKKLFPLRPCDLDIQEGQPYAYEKVRSCLYLHTGECPAPCLGRISAKAYRPLAERAKWFFEGKTDRMLKEWENEMKAQSNAMDFEKAAETRDRIETVRHLHEEITVSEMTEEKLLSRIEESRSVQDLMKGLNLPRPPEIIECFDISHTQGVEKVASMVRFSHGRPDRAHYRKFIIRSVEGIDDFKAMREVVERRVKRLIRENHRLPDLLLIDGGKGQLHSAMKALKSIGGQSVALAALAKRLEEVYVPGRSRPIRLSMDSPGHLLLRYIRDEAHRFAITFHRTRRSKKMME